MGACKWATNMQNISCVLLFSPVWHFAVWILTPFNKELKSRQRNHRAFSKTSQASTPAKQQVQGAHVSRCLCLWLALVMLWISTQKANVRPGYRSAAEAHLLSGCWQHSRPNRTLRREVEPLRQLQMRLWVQWNWDTLSCCAFPSQLLLHPWDVIWFLHCPACYALKKKHTFFHWET